MEIVVTGATGYVGTHLVRLARAHGYSIVAASRRQLTNPLVSFIPFDLSASAPIYLPPKTDAVIHLAANTSSPNAIDEEQELQAAQALLSAAQKVTAKFIFVSSQTARPDAPTAYGRIKWQIERLVLDSGGWVVRPGQVYGGEARGLFGTLIDAVRRMPVLPAFFPVPLIQPIHVDDLAEGLLHLAGSDDIPSGVLSLASPVPVSFTSFLSAIARFRVRRFPFLFPVPTLLVSLFSAVAGEALQTRLGLERLRSLFELRQMETASDLQRLGLTLRPMHTGMHCSGSDRRRYLLREGRALLTYLLGERPEGGLLRRYVRAVECLHEGLPMGLPEFFLRLPVTLALLDDRAWIAAPWGAELAWRLDAATVLAEATPRGAQHFLGIGRKSGPMISLFLMLRSVLCEMYWRVLRILSYPFLRRGMRHIGGTM